MPRVALTCRDEVTMSEITEQLAIPASIKGCYDMQPIWPRITVTIMTMER